MTDSPPAKKSSSHFFVWAAVALFVLVFILPTVFVSWSSRLPEPRAQREYVLTNIEAGGGWDAFKTECDLLISQTRASGQHQSSSVSVSPSPTSCKIISSLKPRGVYVYAVGNMPDYVSIWFWGGKRGGPLTQSYSLIYQQLTNSDRCIAADSFQQPNLVRFNRITNSVFEAYYR
jgi:hypothetical protein